MTETLQAAKWSMMGICFMIGILSQLASLATAGEVRMNWGQLVARLLAVMLFVQSAGSIQGFIWGSAEGIGNSLMPGPTLSDINTGFMNRVQKMRTDRAQTPASSGEVTMGSVLTDPKLMFSILADAVMQAFEHISLTIFFLAYKLLQSAQKVVMMFLAGMAPFILPPSIIPGINSWSSWLKMVISVALWPVVAGFMIKGQFMTAADWLSGTSSGGAVTGMFSSSSSNFFINMDGLQLLAESIFYALMFLASPFISSALVYGGSNVFSAGAAIVLSKPVLGTMTGARDFLSNRFGSNRSFGDSGGGTSSSHHETGSASNYESGHSPSFNVVQNRRSPESSRSARYLRPPTGGASS